MLRFLNDLQDKELVRKLMALYQSLEDWINVMPASIKYHHNWTGGYRDHTCEVIQHAINLYRMLYTDQMARFYITHIDRKPDFTLDDVILVAFIHDLDKLFRYVKIQPFLRQSSIEGREWDYVKDYPAYDDSAKVVQLCAKHGIILEDKHLEALAMHHGGWSDKAQSGGKMTPLAVIVHSADLISSTMQGVKNG